MSHISALSGLPPFIDRRAEGLHIEPQQPNSACSHGASLFSTAAPSEKGKVVERIQRVGRTYQLAAIAGGFSLLLLGHSSN